MKLSEEGPQWSCHYVITQVVLKALEKDTAEVTTNHFGLQVLANLQSERALSL